MSLDELTQTAIALPEEDRRTLIDTLIDSLPEEKAWDDDIDHDGPGAPPALTLEEIHAIAIKRCDELDSGKVKAIPFEQFKREMEERFS